MTLTHADQLQLQRYLDGELSAVGAAAFAARLQAEPELAAAAAAATPLREAFASARRTAPAAPRGFAASVAAATRQLPSRLALENLDAAAGIRRMCQRVLLAAAVVLVASLAVRAGWIATGFGAPLQASPDEVARELQELDSKIRKETTLGTGNERR